MYNDKVLDHFANPRNVGDMENPSGVGHIGNPSDGDKITIYIKVEDDILADVMFKAFGCGAAIAASSMLTELAKGLSVEEGLLLTDEQVAQALGGLPPQKMECSNIAAGALHEAIRHYLNTKGDLKKADDLKNNSISSPSVCAPLPQSKDLLSKEQINRYLRHIIIPQISGKGQKQLLDTKISLYAPSIDQCDVLLFYLLAVGLKQITIYLGDTEEETNLQKFIDFDPSANVKLVSFAKVRNGENRGGSYDNNSYRIVIGDRVFLSELIDIIKFDNRTTLVALAESWRGSYSVCLDKEQVLKFLDSAEKVFNNSDNSVFGLGLSQAFLSTIIVTEVIKLILKLGSNPKMFFYDLLSTSFGTSLDEYTESLQNWKIASGIEENLTDKRVLVVGAGGLGSPVSYALAKSGVGTIGLVDYDHVEASNLNRQILHSPSKIGILKVESAQKRLTEVALGINIELHPVALDKNNARELIKNYDLVVDGLDNIPTRYILNDACYYENRPLIEGGVLTFYGQLTTIFPNKTPCYRCFLPEKEDTSATPPCSELGVLGTLPGVIGILEAVEAIKVMLGIKSRLEGSILMYDGLESEFTIIPFLRNDKCELCSGN